MANPASQSDEQKPADPHFAMLFNQAAVGLFQISADGHFIHANDFGCQMLGRSREALLAGDISQVTHPDDLPNTLDGITRVIDTGELISIDKRYIRPDGTIVWSNSRLSRLSCGDASPPSVLAVTVDLTERRRIEEALRDSEEKHRLIVENARDYAIFMVDLQSRVTTWNTGAERIFGYAESEIIGQPFALLFTPEDRAQGVDEQELAVAAAEGRASDDRWQLRKGGERFFASGMTTPLRTGEGELRGFVKICRDLTEPHKIQEQRERLLEQERLARLEAERAMILRDEFLAVVSHELRTPLTAILLWVKLLRSGKVAAANHEQALETIEMSAQSQRQLIADLLDVSRMIAGKLRLDVRDEALVPVVQSAIDAVRPMAAAKGIELDVLLDEKVGLVRIDPDRIQQVVWNVLNNAVKFTDGGGSVMIEVWRARSAVTIQVTDSGQGITPEFLPYVFERFRQADASMTRTQGGLGLGLSISRQLIELHGGTIEAASDGAGKGSRFTIELPLADLRPTAERSGPAVASEAVSAARFLPSPVLRGVRVLLVEDEANTRAAVQWLLKECGADVTAVESAALAMAAFRAATSAEPFGLIVSDIGMPVQDGYELMLEIRALESQRGVVPAVPALAMTAYARKDDRARAMAVGFNEHLPKPIEPAVLIATAVRLTEKPDDLL
ncbi:MAG TPA: PAS domain S-box protein [Tepidisphaeraceae bacterium]